MDIKPVFQSVLPFETAKEQTATQRREIKKALLKNHGTGNEFVNTSV